MYSGVLICRRAQPWSRTDNKLRTLWHIDNSVLLPSKARRGRKGQYPMSTHNSCGKFSITVAGVLAVLVCCGTLLAMPANPAPFSVSQPDGTRITLRIRGDEKFSWREDMEGFTVTRNSQGEYVYATLDASDRLAPSKLIVGKDDPKTQGLRKRILPAQTTINGLRATAMPSPQLRDAPQPVPPAGTVKNLVVLCKFSDHVYGTHTRDRNDYDVLMNAIGGDPTLAPTGSVKDCYLENSYGTMTLESTVAAWVTLPQTEAYYVGGSGAYGIYGTFPNNAQGMVRDALDLVDSMIDFGEFDTDNDGYIDAIDIIHSGYGAETGGGNWIWSHRWSLYQVSASGWTSNDTNSLGQYVKVYDYHTEPALWGTSGTNIVRFGVIAHETGHFFGLPDYYDTDDGGEGIGSFGMMGNSWGFDFSQLHPPHFSAYSKAFLGWLTPTVITNPGIYTAPQVETNPTAYRVDLNYPSGEFLLIENRQPVGIESAMPQGGLVIWHVDEGKSDNTDEGYPGQSGWPANNNHYRLAVLQADGNYDLERGNNRGDSGDVYHGGGVSAIDETTVPSTDSYQGGIVYQTGNAIHSISVSGSSMTFTFGDFVPCVYDEDCDDSLFCTGDEYCDQGQCFSTGDPCGQGQLCADDIDACMSITFSDDFEQDLGWTDSHTTSSGSWDRDTPVNASDWDYDPVSDSDGSGKCYLTWNETGNTDVDNGSMTLVSPTMDMAGSGASISYDYYLYLTNEDGSDRLLVEMNSNDGVGGWTEVARHTTNGGLAWRNHVITQADLTTAGISLTSTMKIRFTANDADTQSIVEAGLDAFVVAVADECSGDGDCDDGLFCNGSETCDDGDCVAGTSPCSGATPICDEDNDVCLECMIADDCDSGEYCDEYNTCQLYGDGDFDEDGDVDLADFAAFQRCFNTTGVLGCSAGNMAGDESIDLTDLAAFVDLLTGP